MSSLRSFDQGGEDIGRKRVDGEDMRQAVAGDVMVFAKADTGVVDNAIERTERVDLRGDLLGGCDRGEIADDDGFGLGQGLLRVRRARVVARMQDDLMVLIGKIPANHQTKTIGRAGNENARHAVLLNLGSADAYRAPCVGCDVTSNQPDTIQWATSLDEPPCA